MTESDAQKALEEAVRLSLIHHVICPSCKLADALAALDEARFLAAAGFDCPRCGGPKGRHFMPCVVNKKGESVDVSRLRKGGRE